MIYDQDEPYGFEIKLPQIKFPEFKLPEIKLPEIKIPKIEIREYKIPPIKTYDPVRDIGMSGHDVLIRYGPMGHRDYITSNSMTLAGSELFTDSYRTMKSTFQTHQ